MVKMESIGTSGCEFVEFFIQTSNVAYFFPEFDVKTFNLIFGAI
jgi:hypothetical protein